MMTEEFGTCYQSMIFAMDVCSCCGATHPPHQ
jgi:hypothetical protein